MPNKPNTSPDKRLFIIYIVLTLATLAVFWQVHQCDFINFDDRVYIIDNSYIRSGMSLDGFCWAFSTRYADLWHPLLWLSFMFDYQLYGLNPGGYHLTNLILHILSTLLLFWLFQRMTGALWRSAFVAALFALHPLHVESVAWIPERKDVLSALFWMLTLCLYVYYTEKPVVQRYLLVVFSFVCALMSKPMVVTLPVIMILLDYWPLNRFESKKGNLVIWQLKEKILFFVLSAILTIINLYNPGKPSTINYLFPLSSRIANAPVSFVTYLEKTFWPHDLAFFYPFSNQLQLWQITGATFLILAISTAVILTLKRLPYVFVGWFWYVITLVPVLGIMQIGNFAMADRYTYLPSIGIAVILAWGIPLFFKHNTAGKVILFSISIIFFIILSVLTWKQCNYWQNSNTLFRHALRVTQDNYLAHANLAPVLVEEGKIEEAIDHYNKSIFLIPSADTYYNRGNAYIRLGKYQQAVEDLNKVITLIPASVEAHNNRGAAYIKLGLHKKALDDFSEAIRLNPDYPDAYNNRSFLYFRQGDKLSGCKDAQMACKLGDCSVLKVSNSKGLCR